MHTNWPTGGGDVVVEVDVDVLVEEEVEVLLLVVVLLVVGAMVVVVVGPNVVVVVVLVDINTTVLVPTADSVVGVGELLDASHPVATTIRVMIGSATSLVN